MCCCVLCVEMWVRLHVSLVLRKQPNLAVLAASVSSQVEMLSLHKQVQKFISSLFVSLLFNHHVSWNPFFYRPTCPPLLHHLYLGDTIVSVSSFNFLIDSASISTGLVSSLAHRDAGKKRDFSQVQKFTSPPSILAVPSGTAVSRRCMFIFPSQICRFHVYKTSMDPDLVWILFFLFLKKNFTHRYML